VDDLQILQTYYWKIVARDSEPFENESDVWSFTCTLNDPPYAPQIDGTNKGKAGEEYEYTFTVEDPEGEDISLKVDWGDGNVTDWIGPVNSGDTIELKHTWQVEDQYTIKAWAKDHPYEQIGPVKEKVVKMPIVKTTVHSFFLQFFYSIIQHFPMIEKILSSFFIFF
jgi:hypothetical protein